MPPLAKPFGVRKILWYSSINELDYEMQMLFEHVPGYEMRLAIPTATNDYFFPVDVRIDYPGVATREEILATVRDWRPDLLIHRYRRPPEALLDAAEESGVPVLVWVSEQGPDRDIEWVRNRNFAWLAANNIYDVQYYKNRGIEHVYYWPFGCLPFFHRPVPPEPRFKTDLVGYGNPIYTLYESKRSSVDILVRPLVAQNFDVALWGRKQGEAGGWLDVPGVQDGRHYKGQFNYAELPAVNASARIVLGITSNGRYGAFGSRLARAMGCASFCIWAYSEGMEEMPEGYANHKNCCWSTHPDETVELARYYLAHEDERQKIALAGQQLAYDKLDYTKFVPRIIEDMLGQTPQRSHSRYYAMVRDMNRAAQHHESAKVIALGHAVQAHDESGMSYELALSMARAFLQQGQCRLTLSWLERANRLLEHWERRLSRSGDKPALSPEIARHYGAIFELLAAMIEPAISGTDGDANALLRGLLTMHGGRRAFYGFITELARGFSQQLYREGKMVASLRAFNAYMLLHSQRDMPDELYHRLRNVLLDSLGVGGARRERSLSDPALPTPSHDELFADVLAAVPLDRLAVVLAGDALSEWGDALANNIAPTFWVPDGSAFRPSKCETAYRTGEGDVPDANDPRATTKPDCLVYLILSDDSEHWVRLQRLTARLAAGGCVLLATVGEPARATHRLEAIGLRPAFGRELDGRDDLDFAPGHALAGRLCIVGAWKSLPPRERLLALSRRLAERLDPRISHVTLEPREILAARYAWAEGYAQVMAHVCRTEHLDCRVFTLRAPPSPDDRRQRQHTLVEVRVEGRLTTWDPMLGIGYEGSVRDLIAQPERAGACLGERGGRNWSKYGLERFTGAEFFAAVDAIAERADLADEPRFVSVREALASERSLSGSAA